MNPTPRTILSDLFALLGVTVGYAVVVYLVSLGG